MQLPIRGKHNIQMKTEEFCMKNNNQLSFEEVKKLSENLLARETLDKTDGLFIAFETKARVFIESQYDKTYLLGLDKIFNRSISYGTIGNTDVLGVTAQIKSIVKEAMDFLEAL
jgi:hypothetical protein